MISHGIFIHDNNNNLPFFSPPRPRPPASASASVPASLPLTIDGWTSPRWFGLQTLPSNENQHKSAWKASPTRPRLLQRHSPIFFSFLFYLTLTRKESITFLSAPSDLPHCFSLAPMVAIMT